MSQAIFNGMYHKIPSNCIVFSLICYIYGLCSGSKKDPGVPNLCPFKHKILEEVERRKLAVLKLSNLLWAKFTYITGQSLIKKVSYCIVGNAYTSISFFSFVHKVSNVHMSLVYALLLWFLNLNLHAQSYILRHTMNGCAPSPALSRIT